MRITAGKWLILVPGKGGYINSVSFAWSFHGIVLWRLSLCWFFVVWCVSFFQMFLLGLSVVVVTVDGRLAPSLLEVQQRFTVSFLSTRSGNAESVVPTMKFFEDPTTTKKQKNEWHHNSHDVRGENIQINSLVWMVWLDGLMKKMMQKLPTLFLVPTFNEKFRFFVFGVK